MPMPKPISIGTLAIANHTFEEELRKNPAAFRAFLDTMANYHKYPLESQESLHQAGVKGRIPLATPAQWKQVYDRQIKEGEIGIPTLRTVFVPRKNMSPRQRHETRIVYPLSATEPIEKENAQEVSLWKFDATRHADILNNVLPGSSSLSERIRVRVLEHLPENSGDPEAIAAATAHIVLHRLDLEDDYTVSKQALQNMPIHKVLENSQREAFAILEAIGKEVKAQQKQEAEREQEQEAERTRTMTDEPEEAMEETPETLGIDPSMLEDESASEETIAPEPPAEEPIDTDALGIDPNTLEDETTPEDLEPSPEEPASESADDADTFETPDDLGIDPNTLEDEDEEEEEFLTPEDYGIDPEEQDAIETSEQKLQQAVEEEEAKAIRLDDDASFTFSIQPDWTEEQTIDEAVSQIERLTLGYQEENGRAFPYEQAIHTIWQTVCHKADYATENLERVTDAQEIAIHTIFTIEAMRAEEAKKAATPEQGQPTESQTPEPEAVSQDTPEDTRDDLGIDPDTVEAPEEAHAEESTHPSPEASLSMHDSIHDWFKEARPDLDDYKLISDITFQELLDAMQAGYEGYAVMGHGVDSFLREAIFEELSKRSGLPYDEIYTLWLEAERPYPKESIRDWYHYKKNLQDPKVNEMHEMTFDELLTRLQNGEDAYKVIGVEDSAIREILLRELARRYEISIDEFLQPSREEETKETAQEENQEKSVEAFFDDILAPDRLVPKAIDELTKDDTIRDWYRNQYPEDTAGSHIPLKMTFGQLYAQLQRGRSIDEIIPNLGADSIIRERILSGVSEVMGDDAQALQDAILKKQHETAGDYHPPIEPREPFDPVLLDFSIPGTRVQAFEQCKDALVVLRALQNEHRASTEAEQETLRNYPGFAGIASRLFSGFYIDDPQWKERSSVMKALLKEIGIETHVEDPVWPRDDAFEPDPALLRGIYQGLMAAGFKGGRVLNLHAGTGRYYDTMPDDMKEKSQFVAVNDDRTARKIFSALHPDLTQSRKDFRETAIPENAFDLAIGRVSYQTDDKHPAKDVKAFGEKDAPSQTYELQKLIQSVRPGGLVVALVNRSFLQEMTRPDHVDVNRYASLVGAFHLPTEATRNSALPTVFSNMNTYMDYDVILFKKRERVLTSISHSAPPEYWIDPRFRSVSELNLYYQKHPEHVLGVKSQRLGNGAISADKPADSVYFTDYEKGPVSQRLAEGIKELGSFYTPDKTQDVPLDLSPSQPAVRTDAPYGYMQNEEGALIYRTAEGEERTLSYDKEDQDKILAILPVRDAAEQLLKAEAESCSDHTMKNLQQELMQAYDTYRKAYGPILGNSVIEKKFCASDRTSWLLLSLEVQRGETVEKSAIFTERILRPEPIERHTDSISRALELSLANRGHYDMAYCAELTGRTEEDLVKHLPDTVCYDYEQGIYVPKEEYLSGNLYKKLEFLHDYEQHLRDENFYRTQEERYPLRTFPPFVPKDAEEARIVQAAGHLKPEDYAVLFQNEALLAQYLHEDATLILPLIEAAKNTDTPEAKAFAEKSEDPAFYFRLLQQGMEFYNSHSNRNPRIEDYGGKMPDGYRALSRFLTSTVPLDDAGKSKLYPAENGILHLKFSKRDGALQAFLAKTVESGAVKDWQNLPVKKSDELLDDLWAGTNRKITEEILAAEKTSKDPVIQKNLARIEEIHKNRKLLEQEVSRHTVGAQDIAVDISSPWIPPTVLNSFFHAIYFPESSTKQQVPFVTACYDPAEAKYSLHFGEYYLNYKRKDFDALARSSASLYYTKEVQPSEIIEAALNHKTLQVMKRDEYGKKTKEVDYRETILAQQKVEDLRSAFRDWVKTSDMEIFYQGEHNTPRELLTRLYNARFPGILPRHYDGSHLPFTGMNPTITLQPHQKDAVARILYGGNTLLAHSVGAGKTFEMAASLMEAKRLGLAHKGVMVMPKHLTGSFAEEFRRLYPGAKLLVANDDDFTPQKKQAFLTRMKHGNYDAIILNYGQLEKIPLSRKGRTAILDRAIADNKKASRSIPRRNSAYTTIGYEEEIERLKNAKKVLPEEDPELRGLCFDDLGIDRLYVDEAQYYKNLRTKTKMHDIVGVSTTGAGKTDGLFEKCQYLNNKTHYKGVIFATGTPISNSVTELYTLQRYLQGNVLQEMGVSHFDAWASTFGRQQVQLDLGQDGKSMKQRMHFSAFTNVPELLSAFYQVADIRTADMLQLDTPEEKLHYVTTKPSATQKEGIKMLGERAQAIYDGNPWNRTSRVDGTEYPDNMLTVTTDGRLLALDPRLLDPNAKDYPDSKVNQCVKNVARIFKETEKEKGTQLIFCDTGTPDKKKTKDFCLYDDIREKLVKAGVPKSEIAFVHDATTDKQKLKLFEKVREGKVRILLGSTSKLGVGTNVQDRVTAIHDLDVPWRPSDLTQRKGRGVRQGNRNDSVDIYRYITQNTFDAYLWQINENKQRFLSQVMTSRTPSRTIEDVDRAVLTCAEAKALAVGDSKLKDAMVLQNETMRLSLERDAYLSLQDRMAEDLASYYPEEFQHLKETKKHLEADYRTIQHSKDKTVVISGKSFPQDRFPYLLKKMQERIKDQTITGTYQGIPIACHKELDGTLQVKFQFQEPRVVSLPPLTTQRVIKNRIENLPQDILDAIAQSDIRRSELKRQQERDEKVCGKPFPKEEQYLEKRIKLQHYDSILKPKASSKEKEQEQRTNLILSPQDGTFTPCERYFLAYARSYMEQTGGEWDGQADALAVKALEEKHFHPSRIFDAIEKFSPTVPSIQELQKAFQQSKLSRV